ncbi:MAG: hypothetical protein LBQ79_10350 [Deltaproteobacteria bacterium]|jgi:hypothetical protein|nr:hypothetical protein [Deltaproteobacteria bacterium]
MFALNRPPILAAIIVAALMLLAFAVEYGKAEPEPAPFYMCYRGHEYLVYTDARTGRQGVAMSYDITKAGYEPRRCEGTPEEMRGMNP